MNTQNNPCAPVASWLHSLGYKNINHISLKIQNQTFYGCSYDFTGIYTRGMDAVSRGHKQEGEEYLETRFYLVGDLPIPYQKNPNKTCFTQNNQTYYISCYSDKFSSKEHSPFGNSFMLAIWNTEKYEEIDQYHQNKYNRIPISIETI